MAKLVFTTIFIYILFVFITQIQAAYGDDHAEYKFVQSADQKPPAKMMRREKLSHFKFYWHDILGGKAPTAIMVVPPAKTAAQTGFGMVRMMDNPLTLGPDLNSTLVGRCQGFYASASQEDFGLLMTMNFVFVEGKYNGSTITILGRNPVFDTVREMPVIGGSKLFRFARGYAEARTHTFDLKSGDATVEYNLHVMHY